ncbi:MAG TPA: ATP-grasp domain-containing protein [Hyphomicrobium sp.]
MSRGPVLIAALSGRALAASARRAGFVPLVVDAFGDDDTRSSAAAYLGLPEATRVGFHARSLLAALEDLAAHARPAPVGLVLGSGFEATPKLVATLARRFPLLGSEARAIARAKEPAFFFPLLDELAIPHPETRASPPAETEGWLSKRIGGSGGAHVVPCAAARSSLRRYAQRRLDGEPVSVLVVAGGHRLSIVGFSRQWTVAAEPRPYRYGGAVGPAPLDPAVKERMTAAAEAVCGALHLIGLVSFDFLLAGAVPYLLEVNPRPGATLDVFDDASGSLFAAHVAACRGEGFTLDPLLPPAARAAGVLYADQGPLSPVLSAWPSWAADRPMPGTRIQRHRPVATVLATGETAAAAELNCRRRLDELALMLYGRAPDWERNNAKTYRPRPERVDASGQAR